MRLVETWLEAERSHYGNSQGGAVRELNDSLGMTVTQSRVSEWRRGKYCPSIAVISWALQRALPYILKQAGLSVSDQKLAKLEALLWDPSDEA